LKIIWSELIIEIEDLETKGLTWGSENIPVNFYYACDLHTLWTIAPGIISIYS